MQRFRDIVVLAPDEPSAADVVERAAALARRNGARLTLYDAVAPLAATRKRGATPDLERLIVRGRRGDLDEIAARIDGVEVVTAVDVGDVFITLIRRVVRLGHDLVIAAPDRPATRRSGLGGASTVLHLLRKCPCPVWVDDPLAWGRKDVLVAVGLIDDGSDLDRTLLQLGSSLAAIQGGELHVVHGWRLEGESLMRGSRYGLRGSEVDAMAADELAEAQAGLERLLAEPLPEGVKPHVHLRKGRPADVVVGVAAEVRPGVAVMGTLARAGIEGVVIGNTAERVLDGLDGSVLAVKPPGFRSPIT